MARKHQHEDHLNHEAWAIPYGDLVTLLLALFVVLYSMSSVNEGKYRVLSDSLNEAFGGKPRAAQPIQIGDQPPRAAQSSPLKPLPKLATPPLKVLSGSKPAAPAGELQQMADQVHAAMSDLIDKNLIRVRRTELALEIEIGTDILFTSGVANIANTARPVLARLAAILKPFPNSIRVEGHTDDLPIATIAFPSNWQLSSARAASVVALFMGQGIAPVRMSVAGFGEYRPLASNDSADGRNRNRRVLIVIPRTEPPTVTAAFDDSDASDWAETPLAQQLGPAVDRAIELGSVQPIADQDLAATTLATAPETTP